MGVRSFIYGLGFYAVGEKRPTVTAYRTWLSVPSSGARAFFFDFDYDEVSCIRNAEADRLPTTVYDARGRRLSVPAKGLNIMVHSDGSVRKVLIK